MKKHMKIMAIVLAFLGISTTAYSWGVGASFGIQPLGGNPGQNVLLSVKPDQVPFLLGAGVRIAEDEFSLGLTADWWALNEHLVSFLNIYVGPGLYTAIGNEFELGGRVPVGLNAFPVDFLELFFEVAPTLALVSPGGITFPDFGLQGAIGFRFWF
ncbi:hypothetical protein [Spirochaeta africana]|uniref:Uncharacterized protein n=1 Tax=Spirochaeta africana (strain ATCC 700263 / DSM 8902 / Z-7692) TaxID=889378 RepID=H9UKZ9_SPIAZ|nr:hypothetical protein [Spirochaeta africana]AFG38192.1 hypothetical protein Spiaf_2152 [Spirochaeta africana DSM 8902]